ncbi:MAG: polyphenol oxidase family protein [SAR324 cluster bacterium]|nr:polyphenol oxidase family protein [SAR324 cluster bacterium]
MTTAFPKTESQPELLQAQSLRGTLPGVVHGFTTSFPFSGDPSASKMAAELLASHLGSGAPRPLMLEQPHSANVLSVEGALDAASLSRSHDRYRNGFVKGFDGAETNLATPTMLAIRAADCVPVLAVDKESRRFGALHAGWRGTAAGILSNLLGAWREKGSSLREVRLAFGPGIRVCCYEVGEDCLSRFEAAHLRGAVQRVNGASHLDLTEVLRIQARQLGVAASQIEVLPYCTHCHEAPQGGHPFASYRRSGSMGSRTEGRNASFIGVGTIKIIGVGAIK